MLPALGLVDLRRESVVAGDLAALADDADADAAHGHGDDVGGVGHSVTGPALTVVALGVQGDAAVVIPKSPGLCS